MNCNKCGKEVKEGTKFCTSCGNKIIYDKTICSNCGRELKDSAKFCSFCGKSIEDNPSTFDSPNVSSEQTNSYSSNNSSFSNQNDSQNSFPNQNMNQIPPSVYINKAPTNNSSVGVVFVVVSIVIFIVGGLFISVIGSALGSSDSYYSDHSYDGYTYTDDNNYTDTKNIEYIELPDSQSTVIVYDNYYENQNINSEEDVKKLIQLEADSQREKCPDEIKSLELEFQNKYHILGVNLCEMDPNFARNFDEVFSKMYRDYPGIDGYLSNFTLQKKGPDDENVYAYFQFGYSFASSVYKYYYGNKVSIRLLDYYYLHPKRVIQSAENTAASGYHPANTSAYSTVAHEIGHYIDYLVTMKHYGVSPSLLEDTRNNQKLFDVSNDWNDCVYAQQLVNEAYQNYLKDGGKVKNFERWFSDISGYAKEKDEYGNYQFHETIGEAVEDVYANGNQANAASRYIVDVLKEKLRG